MKSLILEKYECLVPEEPDIQILYACKQKLYGAVNLDTVLAQYKYSLEHDMKYESSILYEYLSGIVGNQLDSIGGSNVRKNLR